MKTFTNFYNKRGEVDDGVNEMRRYILLIGGLCAGFCVLWFLCSWQISAFPVQETPALFVETVDETQAANYLQFPFSIPGTTLIAEQIVSYDGLVFENNVSCDVVNAAALLLYNWGENGILEAEVTLQSGSVEFVFAADTIPAGARILVTEENAMEYGPEKFTSCSGEQKDDLSDWQRTDLIRLDCPSIGEVVVTNCKNERLTGIYLLYKSYYDEADFYVGGQTHIYYIEMLDAGQSIRIYPQFYASGYSRFVQVKVENE